MHRPQEEEEERTEDYSNLGFVSRASYACKYRNIFSRTSDPFPLHQKVHATVIQSNLEYLNFKSKIR